MKIKTLRKYKLLIFIPFILIFVSAVVLTANTNNQSVYQGLPAVPCIDFTKPVVQNYSFKMTIYAELGEISLPANIGHDPANCLRVIHTNDTSGTVYVRANDKKQYTLDDFFKVWHKNFELPIFDELQTFPHSLIGVFVNGKQVSSREHTLLNPNETLTVSYRHGLMQAPF